MNEQERMENKKRLEELGRKMSGGKYAVHLWHDDDYRLMFSSIGAPLVITDVGGGNAVEYPFGGDPADLVTFGRF